MSKKKQIEKMAVIIARNVYGIDDLDIDYLPSARNASEELFDTGYRKQSEGEWKVYFDGKELMCSSCKATFWDEDGNGGTNYCPNCGAKMKGGE